jgi:hypothetical protein
LYPKRQNSSWPQLCAPQILRKFSCSIFLRWSRIQVRWSPNFGHEPSEDYSHGSDLFVVRYTGSDIQIKNNL